MANLPLLKHLYKDSLSLLTDLYELTMAYAYWKHGLADREAVFQLFFRKLPFQGGYALCAGMEVAIEYIQNFHFDQSDLSYLSNLKDQKGALLFEEKFLDYLATFKMEVDFDGMEEGTPVFPYEPLARVQGPIIQAQILESILLNIINFQTLIATKASRIVYAAQGDHVVEFGLRRAQGIDGAIAASRAAFIGGCHSSSNVLAGKFFDIPVMGTHAHSWVMAFEEENEAFVKFGETFPHNCIFLIDTYDSIVGVEEAIKVAKNLNIEVIAVRLDSGDLNQLSCIVRKKLDEAGLKKTKIMATNELNEQIIGDLKSQGAQISLWGVGTNLVTAKDHPALDGVYKLSAIQDKKGNWDYRLKISEQMVKTTNPGISQVRRFEDRSGYVADMLYDLKGGPGEEIIHHTEVGATKKVNPTWKHRDLLIPMLRRGKKVYTQPSLKQIRERGQQELSKFPSSMRRLLNPSPFFSGLEKKLWEEKLQMIEKIKNR